MYGVDLPTQPCRQPLPSTLYEPRPLARWPHSLLPVWPTCHACLSSALHEGRPRGGDGGVIVVCPTHTHCYFLSEIVASWQDHHLFEAFQQFSCFS